MIVPWPALALGALAGAIIAGGLQQLRVVNLQQDLRTSNDALAAMTTQRDGAVDAAEQCSAQVAQLQVLAAERARAADTARRQAAAAAADYNLRADQILAAPFSTPGDPCASAQDLLDRWLNP